MTPIAISFLVFTVVALTLLVGLALKFKGKSHSASHAPGEKPHHGFSIFGYSIPFLVTLGVAEVAIYWYVDRVEVNWVKLAMIGWYVFQLAVWDSLSHWFRHTVLGGHGDPPTPRITLERTAYSVVFPIVSLLTITLFFVWVLQPLAIDKDWNGTWIRLYEAPVFLIWLMLVAHIERLMNWGSGPVITAWCLGIPLLPYLYGGWGAHPFKAIWWAQHNAPPAWLLWLFPPSL